MKLWLRKLVIKTLSICISNPYFTHLFVGFKFVRMKNISKILIVSSLSIWACNGADKQEQKSSEDTASKWENAGTEHRADSSVNHNATDASQVQNYHQQTQTQNSLKLNDAEFKIENKDKDWALNFNGKTLLSFKNIKPTPFVGGLFIPKNQPIANHLIVTKFGDDDSKLFVFNAKGEKIIEVKGGEFFVTEHKGKKYLFTLQDTRSPLMAVVDIENNKILSKDIPLGQGAAMHAWYWQNNSLVGIKNNGKPDVIGNYKAMSFNWNKMQFDEKEITISGAQLSHLHEVKFDYRVEY